MFSTGSLLGGVESVLNKGGRQCAVRFSYYVGKGLFLIGVAKVCRTDSLQSGIGSVLIRCGRECSARVPY